jgi:hypothetical protein
MGRDGQPIIQPPTSLDANGNAPESILAQSVFLPEVFPIPDAKEFNPLGSQATAVVQVNQVIPGTVFDVPANTFGVIRSVTFYITNMLTTTNVTYSLLIQFAAAQGYSQVAIFPRVAPFVSNSFDCMVRFLGPARVQINFDNNDGGTYVVGGSFSGWFWPQASDARWRQSGR